MIANLIYGKVIGFEGPEWGVGEAMSLLLQQHKLVYETERYTPNSNSRKYIVIFSRFFASEECSIKTSCDGSAVVSSWFVTYNTLQHDVERNCKETNSI